MVKLILGRAGSGKTARIFDEIAARVRMRQAGIVLLVPEQYSHEAERELCRRAGDTLSLYGEVLSFTGLARRVLTQCGRTRRVMDRGGRVLCMAAGLRNIRGLLTVYKTSAANPRMVGRLVSIAEQLKNDGLRGEDLQRSAGMVDERLKQKLGDLSLILEAYDAARAESSVDNSDLLQLLAENIASTVRPGNAYYIDGFTDFTMLEIAVVRELIRCGADVTVCLTCSEDLDMVFRVPLDTRRLLRETAADCGMPYSEEWLEHSTDSCTPLQFYCDHLFDFHDVSCSGTAAPADSVTLVTAPDLYTECELAAAHMAELARQGVRWNEIAVAVRSFEDYRAALETMCRRYDVPVFLSGRGDMLQRSIPLVISSALEAVVRGYEYETVFTWLKTGLGPLTPDETDLLENYVLLWNIHGNQWKNPFLGHPKGYNRTFSDDSTAQLAEINRMRELVITPLLQLESESKAASTAAGQAQALADFFAAVRMPQLLQDHAAALQESGRDETAAEYRRVWKLVCDALEQFAAVLNDTPMDAAAFHDLFCLMLSCYDVSIIPVSLDRVHCGELDMMRRRHLKHLLVLGATDTRLPKPDDGSGVFTPDERRILTDTCQLPLGSDDEDYSRELNRIYSCLTLPSDGLYISRPLTETDGSVSEPSMIIDRARALLNVREHEGNLYRARTFSAAAAYGLAIRAHAKDGSCLTEEQRKLCDTARIYFDAQGRADEIDTLIRTARAGRGSLSPTGVRLLYGAKPTVSPSSAERFADCRYAFFLKQGLRAKPREKAVFDPRDYGTYVHNMLEDLAKYAESVGGFNQLSGQDVDSRVDAYIDNYIHTELHDFQGVGTRFQYLFLRLRKTLHFIARDTWSELRRSKFEPKYSELDLKSHGLGRIDDEIELIGRADRVDIWRDRNTLYVRVADYKTGKKAFAVGDVTQGKNLQMLLYLYALQQNGAEYLQADHIVPAGVIYCRARREVVSSDTNLSDGELNEVRRKDLQRSGLLLDDTRVLDAMEKEDPEIGHIYLPLKRNKDGSFSKASARSLASAEQFSDLKEYIIDLLHDLTQALRNGDITANPWKKGQECPCNYCELAHACLFDENAEGWRDHTVPQAEDAWKIIHACAEGDEQHA